MRIFPAIAAALLVLTSARAQEADPASIGVLPEQRQPTAVPSQERNPFSKQEAKVVAATTEDDKASEENRIRRALASLAVVGRTRDTAGAWKVMLGGLILEKGKPVPPVIKGQTEVLRVAEISDHAVELVWLDKSGEPDARRMAIPVDLAPHVHTALAGPAETEPQARNEPQVITNEP